MTLRKYNDGKYIMLHKINFYYFIFQNVLKYVQPNLLEVGSAFLSWTFTLLWRYVDLKLGWALKDNLVVNMSLPSLL